MSTWTVILLCVGSFGWGGVMALTLHGLAERHLRQTQPPKPTPIDPGPKWEVRTETRSGYRYQNEKTGEYTGPSTDVVAVFCAPVRQKDEDSLDYRLRSSKVDIGHHDVKEDDLMEVIPKLVAKAEARCRELEALDVGR